MIRRLFRLVLLAGVTAGIVAAIRAVLDRGDPLPTTERPTGDPWPPLRNNTAPESGSSATAPWVEPTAAGNCPGSHPIKANMKSKIFHTPGQLNYDRTSPDRCYRDGEAAEADGLRAAKR